MDLPVFQKLLVPKSKFISFWSKQYYYPKDHLYNNNIGKTLTEARIWELFLWKNGKPLSEKKKLSVRDNFIRESDNIPSNHDKFTLKSYFNKSGGTIWRIFWLHCNQPNIFPIFDQHVYRAMATIEQWEDVELPLSNRDKVKKYINFYLPFWKEFTAFPSKKVDEALWSYGKFLKSKYNFN